MQPVHVSHRRALRSPRTADEQDVPVRLLTPREVREARLKLALAMCQLVLSDPLPQQLRAPLEIITAFLRELVD
jgi:hypothetical protein